MKKILIAVVTIIVATFILAIVARFAFMDNGKQEVSESESPAMDALTLMELSDDEKSLLDKILQNDIYTIYEYSVSDDFKKCTVSTAVVYDDHEDVTKVYDFDVSGNKSTGTLALYEQDMHEYMFKSVSGDSGSSTQQCEQVVFNTAEGEYSTISECGKHKYSIEKGKRYTLFKESFSDDDDNHLFNNEIVVTFE